MSRGFNNCLVPSRTPGVTVWLIERDGHTMSCELRDDSPFGARWDVLIRLDGELLFSRRCTDEPLARFAMQALLEDHLHAGWIEKGGA
jgi:hypothetical protein